MSCSLKNQVQEHACGRSSCGSRSLEDASHRSAIVSLLRRWKDCASHRTDLSLLPSQLDEQVAKLQGLALGVVLAVFAQEHAGDYTGVDV